MFEHYPPRPGTRIVAEDVSLAPLAGCTIAVIGYGTMGSAQALNLARSGCRVVVGCRPASAAADRAQAAGLTVLTVPEAVARGELVMLMLPDEVMAVVYAEEIEPNLAPDAVLGFAHGFALAFDQIRPAPGRDCLLVAPKAQGDMLRQAHAAGGGSPGLVAVTDGGRPATWDLAAAYAKAVGCLALGGYVTTFRQECVSDQFGEQVVLCGGVIELLKSAFDIMVAGGYGEQNAYFECVHELKLITDLLHRHGVDGMRGMISGTAAYGGLTRGPRIIDEAARERMRGILREIEDGGFAREFLARHKETKGLAAAEAAGNLAACGRRMLPHLHPDTNDDR
jgi:ketol-acid reductoisomerase